ncbi:MAG: TRL-like family protein [Myxococcales bacterium]|nr:TRL-like family protein [Myxococcales bacterium]MCB9582122.1 TRL-like family protein [Polyangiaceae bacterium]
MTLWKLSLTFALTTLAAGCMPVMQQGYPVGVVYNGTKAPSVVDRVEASGPNKTGAKTGEACSTGILGIAAFGDASIDAAKKAAQITDVHSVEYDATAVLGFVYVEVCTVVHGN